MKKPYKIVKNEKIDQFFPNGIDFKIPDNKVGVMFFPSDYRKIFGKKSVEMETDKGMCKFRPCLSRSIERVLEDQGPGTTDMMIPFVGTVGKKVYVVCLDDMTNHTLQIWDADKFDKKEATKLIYKMHNLKEVIGDLD